MTFNLFQSYNLFQSCTRSQTSKLPQSSLPFKLSLLCSLAWPVWAQSTAPLSPLTPTEITTPRSDPLATTEDYGIVRLANPSETSQGTDEPAVVMTASAVQAQIQAAIQQLVDTHIFVPVGAIMAWPADSAPEGWLLLDGQPFDTSQYPKLAALFPTGELPDMRGLTIMGAKAGESLLAESDGELKSHTHSGSIASTNLGSKTTSSTGNHYHYLAYNSSSSSAGGGTYLYRQGTYSGSYYYYLAGGSGSPNLYRSSNSGNHTHSLALGSHNHTLTVNATGGAQNIPAHRKMHWMMRAQ